jgi:hypothetical protein
MRYVDGHHGPGPLRTEATFATAVLPPGEARMLNGSMHAFGELAHKDTVLANQPRPTLSHRALTRR